MSSSCVIDWPLVADFATVFVGIGALLTAYWSFKLSTNALDTQTRHNRLTQQPYPYLAVGDYEERLFVKFVNDGVGPFIIKSVQVCMANECKNDLISWMEPPPEGIAWVDFVSTFVGRALRPGSEIVLLALEGNPGESDFIEFRDDCRRRLSRLTVHLDYTDSYEHEYPTYHRVLEWFGRDK